MRTRALARALLAGWLAAGTATAQAKPNILLVVVDSLRRDHVSAYGYNRATTPALDRLAGEGARFDQAVSASSWTTPSVMSLFTSVPPCVHGVRAMSHRLGGELTTLAAALRRAGYQTAAVTSNPCTHGRLGFSRGFEFYDDFTFLMGVDLDAVDAAGEPPGGDDESTSEGVNRQALWWLRGKWDRKRPFFLHLLYLDPHYSYLPPPPFHRMFTDPAYAGTQTGRGIRGLSGKTLSAADRAHVAALYDGEIRYTDEHVGALVEALRAERLLENTVIVVTGDHGEEFWDHGGTAHGHTLYEELVRVPLIIRHPAAIPAGTVVAHQVSHMDVMPTLLDFAGITAPEQCVGRSLAPLLKGDGADFAGRALFMETETQTDLQALRTRRRKFVGVFGQPACRMFALDEDPAEQRDLAGTPRAAEFRELATAFDRWRRVAQTRREHADPRQPVPLDPALLRQLRSLGYVK